MVAAARRGSSYRSIAKRFSVSLRTIFKWVKRAHGQRLDRVCWDDRPRGNLTPPNRTPAPLVRRILRARLFLQRHSALGEFGAQAIQRHLQQQHPTPVPTPRTIARIIAQHGLVNRFRQRRPPPPQGWYLPQLALGSAELDSFDFIDSLAIKKQSSVEVFNGISLYGSLAACWLAPAFSTSEVLRCLPKHWREFGKPHFAQFDNDTRFQGSHAQAHHLGRVVHLCLCLDIIPVFAPPRETGFQAKIENFNNLWQQKVWHRWVHRSWSRLQNRSQAFLLAHQDKHARRIQSAPPRLPMPTTIPPEPAQPWIFFLRRTNDRGQVSLLEHSLPVDKNWPHRLVRCELDIQNKSVHFYALRRRQPDHQPLLRQLPFETHITPWHDTH